MGRQIFLDTETTGISYKQGNRLIEIGCLEAVDRQLTGQQFHYYINPERDIEEGAFRVHGLSREFLSDKPVFKEVAQAFVDFVTGAELIIHNAPFDVGFLDHELAMLKQSFKPLATICTITDTLVMARQKHPGQKNNLDALCRRYTINNQHRELHGALLDAELLAQVYCRMTGGQKQLFAETKDHAAVVASSSSSDTAVVGRGEVVVATISDDERALHQAYLEDMGQSDGHAWLGES